MRWRGRSIGMAGALGAMAVAVLAIPAAAQEVDAPTVTGASPLSGPAGGGTVVTMTGSGFLPGVTEVMVVGTGYSFQSEIPASAMTINAERTTMSFAMPAAADVATPSASSTSSPVPFAVAMGVLVAGWAGFVVAARRRTSRTTS